MLRAKRVLAGIIDLYISYICITELFILLKEPLINKLQDFELFLDIYNISWYMSLVFKDVIFKNASIGKRLVGIKIVDINNEPVKFYILILRNLLLPIVYPFYFVTILLLNRRYSDRVFKIKIVSRNRNLLQES